MFESVSLRRRFFFIKRAVSKVYFRNLNTLKNFSQKSYLKNLSMQYSVSYMICKRERDRDHRVHERPHQSAQG